MSVHNLTHHRTAATLLAHPLRSRILAAAREPVSASEVARRLGQTRQRVNYHVRQLADAGLLRAAGQQRKRNMMEQQYVASAEAYVLSPQLLGDAGIEATASPDPVSAAHLLSLCARAQDDVADLVESASRAGVRVRTLSVQYDVRFESAEQRSDFSRALLDAVSEAVTRFTLPVVDDVGDVAAGRPFRLLVGFYPIPGERP